VAVGVQDGIDVMRARDMLPRLRHPGGVFAVVGIKELAVADYMAVVCADFGCTPTKGPDAINHSVDSLYSVDYLEAIESASRHHKYFLHVQCANQFLVLTCLYPDFLHRRAERRGAPDVD
jgi:hypothetical protein